MRQLDKRTAREEAEAYVRLTAVQHVKTTHFSRHERVEGYYENRDVPQFTGSDRLLRLDTVYGTVQLGYNPRKRQSFLFANLKTSILDQAASRYQRELKEYRQQRQLRQKTVNTAFTAKRRSGSAVILYNAEAKPWSSASVLPYLGRADMETLEKTMPFLNKRRDMETVRALREEQKGLAQVLRRQMARRAYAEMAETRAAALSLQWRQAHTGALLYRRETQRRLFFRRVNSAYDMQKREMFRYYRTTRLSGAPHLQRDANPPGVNKEGEDADE